MTDGQAELLGGPNDALRGGGTGATPTDKDLRLEFRLSEVPEADTDEEQGEDSKVLKMFENPLSKSNALTNLLSKLLGMSRSPGQGTAGAELPTGSIRRVDMVGPNARPLPVPLHFGEDDTPGPAGGVGGALYPEWDVHKNRYRRLPAGQRRDRLRAAVGLDSDGYSFPYVASWAGGDGDRVRATADAVIGCARRILAAAGLAGADDGQAAA